MQFPVNIHFLPIIEPPQKFKVPIIEILTIQGNSFGMAISPPDILGNKN